MFFGGVSVVRMLDSCHAYHITIMVKLRYGFRVFWNFCFFVDLYARMIDVCRAYRFMAMFTLRYGFMLAFTLCHVFRLFFGISA